jgi:hypothetical protein
MRGGHRDDPETGGFLGERVFASRVDVKYVLQDATRAPDGLIVGFSSANAPERPPRYHWHKLLRDVRCPRLFVLDDHGPRDRLPRPSWYLGRHRRFDVPDSVCDLLDRIIEELGVPRERVVTVGSSMGGWAALYFGARVGAGHAIVAEPQTLLGRYLCGPAFQTLAEHLAGGSSLEDRDFLDSILFDALRTAASPSHVDLYCGRGSPYYEGHVQPLVEVLDEVGVAWELELAGHSEHGEVGLHFPAYLLRRVVEVVAPHGGSAGSSATTPRTSQAHSRRR